MESVSPQTQPAMASSSPPPPPHPASTPHSQLAALLASSYREKEAVQKELASTRKRLESVERQLAVFTKSSSSEHLIADLESRAERAESARDEAEARRQLFTDHWDELNRYLTALEVHAQQARSCFARTVADGGGTLVLAPIPVLGQHHSPGPLHTPPSATNPAIMLIPPSHPRVNHRHSSSSSSLPLPQTSTPSSSRVRPRSGSFDDQSQYLPAPPSKRHRSDRADYDSHHPPRTRPISSLQPSSSSVYPTRSSHASHSRSSSRSSQRSLSIDEMLLEATTDDPRPRNEPQSPRVVLAHHQHPPSSHHHQHLGTGSSRALATPSNVGPLDQPGELRTYQTHVFAPPVTGAPMKKGKPGLANGVQTLPTPSATSTSSTAPPQTPTTSHSLPHPNPHGPPHHPSHPPPQPQHQLLAPQGQLHAQPQTQGQTQPQPTVHRTPNGSYPPTNSLGQRICRQCGLAGRYKEGKCVEKWGPGPEGPGTVCDRCRKKMKRVERRGTVAGAAAMTMASGSVAGDGPNALTQSHTMPARVSRTDTVPAHTLVNATVPNGSPGVGPGGTQLIGSGFGPKRDRERERERGDRERERERYTASQSHTSPSSHLLHSNPNPSHSHLHPLSHLPYHGRSSPSQRSSHGGGHNTPPSSTVASSAGPVAPGGHRPDPHGIQRQTSGGEAHLTSPPPAIETLPLDEEDGPSTTKPLTSSGAAGRTSKANARGRSHRGGGVKRSAGVRASDGSSSASADGDRDADVHADADGEGEGDLDADGEEDADGDGNADGKGGIDAEGDADADVDEEAEGEGEADADMDVDVDSGRSNGQHHRPRRERRSDRDREHHAEAADEDDHDHDRDGEEGNKDPEDDLLAAVAAADRRKGGNGSLLPREMLARLGGRGGAGAQRGVVAAVGVQRTAVKGE